MKKLTKAMDENGDQKTNKSKIPQKRKTRESKKPIIAVDENWETEEVDPDMDVPRKRKIRQTDGTKKITGDPWAIVPHTLLSSRKVTSGSKIKSKNIQAQKITSVQNFFQKNPNIPIEMTPLAQRKAKQIDLLSQTLPQVIKTTLKDYNSINFKVQAS
ncbi:MAG: hypothetical protein LBQ03_01395 [Puniceicoccales bacterium]|jgi:hypothetical protein|nr:hypothetical protein [Puniceicoccales bacterium]